MQAQQNFYDPSLDGLANDMRIVLLGKPFKPLRNIKTGHFFSYSYGVAERNKSANMDNDIEWIDFNNPNIPEKIREKARQVYAFHKEIVKAHEARLKASKFKNLERVEELTERIEEMFEEMDEIIYPPSERKYVESKEAERYRLEQQGELKLDAASIAALTRDSVVPGATADASIAEAKLDVAQKRIDELQAALDKQLQDVKPTPRKKAGVKAKPAEQPAEQ